MQIAKLALCAMHNAASIHALFFKITLHQRHFTFWHGLSKRLLVKEMETQSATPKVSRCSGVFQRFARASARAAGQTWAFGLALCSVVLWAVVGPWVGFSDTWQLTINTATTIITFLMVFLIQNTQNRDSEAMQLKLDELIRSSEAAHNALLDIEELSEEELDCVKARYEQLARKARKDIRAGRSDLGRPQFIRQGRRSGRGKWIRRSGRNGHQTRTTPNEVGPVADASS
jgi:low affinity Fe/Cu permease